MDVLERAGQLAVLEECLAAARSGGGRLVWVQGEAGIGKSALVERFCAGVRGARVVVGSCDPLETPRPLGAALDIGERLGVVERGGGGVSREVLFGGFVEELASRSWVTVAVIEDAHWADEATLDLLRFVGRRLGELRALVVVTLRDDGLESGHPLRRVLGDLATAVGVRRVELPALSRAAVAQLVGAVSPAGGVDVEALFRRTGGNPFFVTEVLAAGGEVLPSSVRDAVLARAGRLSVAARAALDAAAVVPIRAETWLVRGLAGTVDERLDECVAAGMLRPSGAGAVAFRHEVARLAVDEALPPARRASLHAGAAALLSDRYGDGVDAARVAYHAEQAGDGPLAHEHAVRAARRAADLGAHREAVAQYERALRHTQGLTPADHADLLEGYAPEARAIDRTDAALEAAARAVALRRQLGDPRPLATALQVCASSLWTAGHSAEAAESNREAIALLEMLGPGDELAEAYAGAAAFAMLARDHRSASQWGGRALELAEQLGATRIMAQALNSIGSSKIVSGYAGGVEDLQRSIALATEAGLEALAVHGWLNLGSGAGEIRDYATAEPALRRAIDGAAAGDLDGQQHYAVAWLARVAFERGAWNEAAAHLDTLPLDDPRISPITVIVALSVRSRLQVRRGDHDPHRELDRARTLAEETGDLQRLWPIAAARAEAAWLGGDPGAIRGLVDEVYGLACERGHAWAVGELGLWRHRAGVGGGLPEVAAEPYALHVAGRFAEAAAAWEALGCPYEMADALCDGDEPADLRRGLGVLDGLGAGAAAARVRQRLRGLGVRNVPRGPRRATAAHPAGLTPRQAEVLELIALGLSDADIAGRLHLSPKTVGHHVSAILAKLGAVSRGEAAHRARQLDHPPAG